MASIRRSVYEKEQGRLCEQTEVIEPLRRRSSVAVRPAPVTGGRVTIGLAYQFPRSTSASS
jgi:hypothetical protein